MKPQLKALWIAVTWFLITISTAIGSPLTTDYRQVPFKIGNVTYSTPGIYDPTDSYDIGTQKWVANLKPQNPIYLSSASGGVTEYLLSAFPTTAGWSYAMSEKGLSDNSLIIHTYDVIGRATQVGAFFQVEYHPDSTDPNENIHWIQIVSDNHAKIHGIPEHTIDTLSGRSPYYDDGGVADNTNFADLSFRSDGNKSHYWDAELFLVTGPAAGAGPGLITIYGGIGWGWENHPLFEVSEPSALLLIGVALYVLIAVRRQQP